MDNVGHSFTLPFKDPNWLSTFVVMGLITLIPIVGTLVLLGWMLTLLDHYRLGRTDLPPAGFQYIGRGVNLLVVQLIYGLVLVLVILVPVFFIGVAAGLGAATGASSDSPASNAAFGSVFALSWLWIFGVSGLSLVLYFFLAPVAVNTERGGIAAGINPRLVWATASRNWNHTLLAGVLILCAYILASLGIYACCVGYLVTMPYGYAVVAGIIRNYEASFESLPPAAVIPPSL